ncbi:hypothetical protein FB00_13470 [Cellulosimicrobium funkei]|uniref:Uncharacterized protein n=1 Tax=Cellulosimicrobium funkei TaxID=264251 RepID=A0A0H2KLY9_9MICO|nr:hypothetical protein FB00_13470 [Cellulosimicrobium funkei]
MKIADVVGKAAAAAGFVLVAVQVVGDARAVVKEERAALEQARERDRQHRALVTEIMGRADEIVDRARTGVHDLVDPILDELLADIKTAQNEGLAAQSARDTATSELTAIAAESDRLLAASVGDAGFRTA